MKVIHGGDIYSYNEKMLDFSANINPLGMPVSAQNAVIESIKNISAYPDVFCRKLRAKIAEKENVSKDSVICANGAAELIYCIIAAVKPKKVLLTAPAFSEYEQAADTVNAEKIFYFAEEKNEFKIDDGILSLINKSVDIMFICNPNNPTGMLINRQLMRDIVCKCWENGVLLVIDECFMDFAEMYEENSVIGSVLEYKNIFVLKAFTKMYAMAGLRLGYGICGDRLLIEKLYSIRQPWSVSVPAQAAGEAVFGEKEFTEKTRDYIKRERMFLECQLERLGISYFKSYVNFILFKAEKGLCKKMENYGILIRDCGNFRGLSEGFYRIAVKLHRENEIFIRVLEDILRV